MEVKSARALLNVVFLFGCASIAAAQSAGPDAAAIQAQIAQSGRQYEESVAAQSIAKLEADNAGLSKQLADLKKQIADGGKQKPAANPAK